MTEILDQLRTDLMAVLCQYQQLFKEYPMPNIRCRDINKITYIINDSSYTHYQGCINAVERYIVGIKTIWWPFYRKSRLRNSIQSVLDDYQHPQAQALIMHIEMLLKNCNIKHQPIDQQLPALSQWTAYLSEKVRLINELQDILIKLRNEKYKQSQAVCRIYDHFIYLTKHPANESL